MVKGGRSRRNHAPLSVHAGPVPRSPAAAGLWLYGRHAVLAAIANPRRRIHRLLALPETGAALADAAALTDLVRPQVETLGRREIEALLPADAVHQGFAARVAPLPVPELAMHELADAKVSGISAIRRVVVVLDQVTDPRNVGAVLRSAEAFAAAAVIVQDRHAPAESGALAKAASGALERVPLLREVNLARTLRALQEAGFVTIGLAADAPLSLRESPFTACVALVLGAEGSGLRRLVRETCDVLVRVPIAGAAESLNVAATAAVALYECRRSESAG